MKLNLRTLLPCLTAALFSVTVAIQAQTVISGPTLTTSTWSPSGNPHIIAGNTTLATGNSLTILPGTVVWIGDGISLTCDGRIQAAGTSDQRITFQAPISSQIWNTINVRGTSGTNLFLYCDFSNATNALSTYGGTRTETMHCTFSNAASGIVSRADSINTMMFCDFIDVAYGVYMSVSANNWSQTAKILNCTFTNCSVQAIYGAASGNAGLSCSPSGCYAWSQSAWVVSEIRNCSFYAVKDGCRFNTAGVHFSQTQQPSATGYGYGNVRLLNNTFCNVTNTAISLSMGSYAGGGPATLVNNTIVNAGRGIVVQDPWDAKVQSCLFVDCTNAVTRSGSLSATVSYNGFFGNNFNFSGYSSTYGQWIIPNRNGTLADLFFNIGGNPLFVSSTDFHLQTNSPAIDAGTPDWNYSDLCFADGVSQGTSFPDLGAYGGPDAVNWLAEVPLIPAQATISKNASGVVRVSWGAIPRSEYQVQWTTNALTSLTTNWFDVTNGWVRATEKPSGVNVATNPPHAERYYRVQSLGRTPGN